MPKQFKENTVLKDGSYILVRKGEDDWFCTADDHVHWDRDLLVRGERSEVTVLHGGVEEVPDPEEVFGPGDIVQWKEDPKVQLALGETHYTHVGASGSRGAVIERYAGFGPNFTSKRWERVAL